MQARTVVKALICNGNNQVLLLRRSRTAPRRPLQWDLPGGLLDDDASPAAACAREVAEEAGIIIAPDKLVLVYGESTISSLEGSIVSITTLYFLAHVPKASDPKSSEVKLSYEHDQFQWLTLEGAIQTSTYDKQLRALRYVRDANFIGTKK